MAYLENMVTIEKYDDDIDLSQDEIQKKIKRIEAKLRREVREARIKFELLEKSTSKN